MYYVYVLKNENNRLYYGVSNNLKRRLSEHNGQHKGFTTGHTWRLVYYEAYQSLLDAQNREDHLKHHGQAIRRLKQRIINSLNL